MTYLNQVGEASFSSSWVWLSLIGSHFLTSSIRSVSLLSKCLNSSGTLIMGIFLLICLYSFLWDITRSSTWWLKSRNFRWYLSSSLTMWQQKSGSCWISANEATLATKNRYYSLIFSSSCIVHTSFNVFSIILWLILSILLLSVSSSLPIIMNSYGFPSQNSIEIIQNRASASNSNNNVRISLFIMNCNMSCTYTFHFLSLMFPEGNFLPVMNNRITQNSLYPKYAADFSSCSLSDSISLLSAKSLIFSNDPLLTLSALRQRSQSENKTQMHDEFYKAC